MKKKQKGGRNQSYKKKEGGRVGEATDTRKNVLDPTKAGGGESEELKVL